MSNSSHRSISLLDLSTLLVNVLRGRDNFHVGYEDADVTIDYLVRNMANKQVRIKVDNLEKALWSSNLLNERQKFWSPTYETFEAFAKRMCESDEKFDQDYNYFVKKEDSK